MERSIRQSASADHEPNGMTSLIGIDAEGSEHRYDHHRDVVRVERPDGTTDEYGTESISAWCDIVDDACGWDVCHYRMSTWEILAHNVATEHSA